MRKMVTLWSTFLKDEVSYLPVLGPSHIKESSVKKVLHDLLSTANQDVFLPYNKDKRWFEKRIKKIIVSQAIFKKSEVLIPVASKVKNPELRVFYYTQQSCKVDLVKKVLNRCNFKNCTLYSQKKPKVLKKCEKKTIFLKRIGLEDEDKEDFKEIELFSRLSPKLSKTINDLGEDPDLTGFSFLWENITKDGGIGPVFCAVKDERIVGAIGPLDLSVDFFGRKQLLPPYFGVKKEYRRKGYGKKLWKKAINFAYKKGAKYMLVQNRSGSPAAFFYKKQGLENAGSYYQVKYSL